MDYKLTDNREEGATTTVSQSFDYDEENRVARITENYHSTDEYSYKDNGTEIYTFDYTIANEVSVRTTDEAERLLYKISAKTDAKGRITETSSYDYDNGTPRLEGQETYTYTPEGRLSSLLSKYSYSSSSGLNQYSENKFYYTDGLLTRYTYYDSYEASYDPDYQPWEYSLPADECYPHRYANDRSNLDFYMYAMGGRISFENTSSAIFSLLRLTGNYGDCLPEITTAADEDDEPQDTIPQALGRGVFGMFKWLLLVVLFVLIIAGGGVAWLYRSATPDMLPEVKVTFDGQELAPTAYKWHVPVVGSFFRRTYAETLNSSPVVLEDAISDASPDIIVTPSDYSTQLTITDADKETVYEGSATAFRSYLFAENGTFDAKLVVTASDSAAEDRSSVTGTETWQFRFTVSIKPSVTLCTPTVQQGSVAAVRVGSTMSRTEPTLTGPLESTGFVRAANGWICYLPIPWNAETGNTELTVTADGYTETLTLSVRAASYSYKDYSTKSQLTSPYIGADDAPDAVRRLLTTDGGEIQWAVGGFVQPFLDSFDTPLLYGMTEYVGRSYSERSTNYGYGGRTSTNVVIKPKKSKDSMIVPASGHVLLAEDLGGSYGYTVVIDHGAGLRSIFYGLTALDVEAGDDVKQGQLLGTSGRTVVAELRIGTVPINPLLVWRGQCDGLKYY